MSIRPRSSPARWILALALVASACSSLAVRQGGFNLISVDEEWSMREDLRRQVEAKYDVVHDRSATEYLNRIGRQIASRTALGRRRWDFALVDDERINAFNLPGGLVYVHTGLLREAEKLDQLTGVLAHEIGHGAARHGTQLMTRAYGVDVLSSIALGRDPGQAEQVLAQLVGAGVLTRYSREAEREADELGVRFAYEAGYDPRGIPELFRALERRRQREPSKVEQFFASHPLDSERIAATEALISGLPPKRGLIGDSPEYQRFRSRWR